MSLLSTEYETLVKEGKAALERGKLDKTKELAQKALDINPDGVLARILLKDIESRRAAAAERKRHPAVESAPAAGAQDAPQVLGFGFVREETFTCCAVTNRVKIYVHELTGLEFVLVPGGFTASSPA